MNNLFKITLIGLALSLLMGCEKDLPMYNQIVGSLNFNVKDQIVNYSFVFASEDRQEIDTIWCEITTMGFLSNQDRPFLLTQEESNKDGAISAQAGIHYVPFDDISLADYYKIPANETSTLFPIVVKNEASLTETEVSLHIKIIPNEFFNLGIKEQDSLLIIISNMLLKPTAWNKLATTFFGAYGPEKHRFMIQASGERWDDNYLLNSLYLEDSRKVDQTYLQDLKVFFRKKLAELNLEREQEELGKLQEADGTVVSFPN